MSIFSTNVYRGKIFTIIYIYIIQSSSFLYCDVRSVITRRANHVNSKIWTGNAGWRRGGNRHRDGNRGHRRSS